MVEPSGRRKRKNGDRPKLVSIVMRRPKQRHDIEASVQRALSPKSPPARFATGR
jgi:hypothetical protein